MKDPFIQEIRTIRHDLDDTMLNAPKDFVHDIESIRKRNAKRIVSHQGKPKKLKAT
jgi:hypothetical protein